LTAESCRVATALPLAPFVVAWQEEDRPRNLSLAADGSVRQRNRLVARVSGGCILDPSGKPVSLVEGDTAFGPGHAPIGTFRKQPELRVDDEAVRVAEVLASPDGTGTAVADNGSVYLAPPDAAPFSLPGEIKGQVARGRRTALLLWELGHRPAPR